MSESTAVKKRIPELDYMKGLGIILIALYHLVFFMENSIPDKMICSLGWAFIAIFFILSGYTCRQEGSVKEAYARRFRQVILPSVVLEIALLIFGGIYCMIFHGYTVTDVLHEVAVTFLRPEITTPISETWGAGGFLFNILSPVWYIWCMAWTELLFHPIRKWLFGKGEKVWILVFILLVGIQIPMYVFLPPAPWQLTIVPTFLIFMLMGAKLREWNAAERLKKIPSVHAVWITAVCLAAHFGLWCLNGFEYYYVSVYGKNGAWDVFTVILQAVVAFPAIYFVARGIGRLGIFAGAIEWVGKHSLMILLLHSALGMVYCDILGVYSRMGEYWYLEWSGLTTTAGIVAKSVLVWILSLLTCVPICLLIDVINRRLFQKKINISG